MNKTSPMVLALLFSGASALRSRQDAPPSVPMTTDGTTGPNTTGDVTTPVIDEDEQDRQDLSNFHKEIIEQANKIMGKHDVPSNFEDTEFKVMADDGFTMYVNGQNVGEGNDYRETYHFDAVVNKGVDSIAVELYDKRWGGNMLAQFGDIVSSSEWVCRDVPSDGMLPEGWNTNGYDDQSWAPAMEYGRNNIDETPWPRYGYTNSLFPEDAAFIWNSDDRAEHVMCRYNQRPFEERAQHNDVCQDEMEAFENIANQLINHHQHRQSIWQDKRRELRGQITQLINQNTGLSNTIDFMKDAAEKLAEMHRVEVEELNNDLVNLKEHYEQELDDLENKMNEECGTKLHNARVKLDGEWSQVLDEARNAHENAMQEARDAHDTAMRNQAEAHDEHLEQTKEQMTDAHNDAMRNKVNELERQHDEYVDNKVKELNEAFDISMEQMEDKLAQDHQENLAEELRKLRHELTQAYEREIKDLIDQHDQTLTNTVEDYTKRLNQQSEVMGAEIDRLTRKHDYLYESCTTVQVVDGELVIN